MQNLLQELGLQALYPRLQAKNVDLSIFKDICIVEGHLRMSSVAQRILFTDCGLKTKQVMAILQKYKELPASVRCQPIHQQQIRGIPSTAPPLQARAGNKRLSALLGGANAQKQTEKAQI